MKDISLAEDQVITSFSINHTGNTISKSFSFTPSAGGSYYVHLVFQGSTIWSQPNDASRLAVQASTTTVLPFSVTSYSWSPKVITVGASATISITLSGGTAGNYSLEVMKDISLAEDQVITSFSINHTGNTISKSFSFTPSAGGSYYVHLVFQGSTIWSQPNDSSRLRVTIPIPVIKIQSIDIPPVLTVGLNYNYMVTLQNYESISITVDLSIDSPITGHMSSTQVSLPPNGNQTAPQKIAVMQAGTNVITYSVLYNNQRLDSLTKNIETKAAGGSSVVDWRKNIQPGDILLSRSDSFFSAFQAWFGNFWTHAGIYVGDGKVIEAKGLDEGVTVTDITSWDYNPTVKDSKSCVGLLRVKGTDVGKATRVISFIYDQVGDRYGLPINIFGSLKSYDSSSSDWYCSELVWAGYMQVGTNIEYTPDSWWIWPQEIDDDEDTDAIGIHAERIPSSADLIPASFLILHLHSPADLVVTDPDGLVVSTKQSQIAESIYIVDDFDEDGDPESMVGIPNVKAGDYRVEVIPKSDVSPAATYSLEAGVGGQRTWLASNIPIGNIPSQGYSIMVGIPPTVTTDYATNINADSASLNGYLTSLGTDTSIGISFQWGTSSGNYTIETTIVSQNSTDPFSSSLTGLLPNTTYYYRAKADGDGVAYGTENSFTTLSFGTSSPPNPNRGEDRGTTSASSFGKLDIPTSPSNNTLTPSNQSIASFPWMLISIILIVIIIIGIASIIIWRFRIKHD
jgi:uncharacterized protein YycO